MWDSAPIRARSTWAETDPDGAVSMPARFGPHPWGRNGRQLNSSEHREAARPAMEKAPLHVAKHGLLR